MTISMMLTALDGDIGAVLDLTTIGADVLVEYHGHRNRRRHGHHPKCRGCGGDVHVVHSRGDVYFWRHNPGRAARSCVVEEAARRGHGMSPEHLAGVATVATGIRKLTGWTAQLEAFHGEVRLDVEATFAGRSGHPQQRSAAWEVQVSDQPDSTFVDRTEHIAKATGLPTLWVTPHIERVGALEALIVDPTVELVTERIVSSIEPRVASSPTPLERVVRSLLRPAPGHLLVPLGEHGEWHIVDVHAFDGQGPARVRGRRAAGGSRGGVGDADDRDCDRPPVDGMNAHIPDGVHRQLRARLPITDPPLRTVRLYPRRTQRAKAARFVTTLERSRCSHSLSSRWPDGRVRCSFCGLVLDETEE